MRGMLSEISVGYKRCVAAILVLSFLCILAVKVDNYIGFSTHAFTFVCYMGAAILILSLFTSVSVRGLVEAYRNASHKEWVSTALFLTNSISVIVLIVAFFRFFLFTPFYLWFCIFFSDAACDPPKSSIMGFVVGVFGSVISYYLIRKSKNAAN